MRLLKRTPRDHTPCSTCGHPREEHYNWSDECGECEDAVEVGDMAADAELCLTFVWPKSMGNEVAD